MVLMFRIVIMTINIIVSSENIQTASNLLKTIDSNSKDFHVQQMFNKRAFNTDSIINSTLDTCAPWIFFAILSLLIWTSYLLIYFCNKYVLYNKFRCQTFKNLSYLIDKNPHKKLELLIPLTLTIVFSIIIFGSSIGGLVIKPYILG